MEQLHLQDCFVKKKKNPDPAQPEATGPAREERWSRDKLRPQDQAEKTEFRDKLRLQGQAEKTETPSLIQGIR